MQTSFYPEITAPRWGPEELEYHDVLPKKPWVYGTGKQNALIHRIRVVRLRWWTWEPDGQQLTRLQSPRMMAMTYCSRYIPIDSTKGKTCSMPKPDAVVCAACLGKGRNFPRSKNAWQPEVPLKLAQVRLGCVEEPL